jgi:GrpB-like predicted nucleotidyltransferase (UPF0157 family)
MTATMVRPLLVKDYDPSWPAVFQALREPIAGVLGDISAAIEHVGSTAVPHLAAKPIIDIDVLLASDSLLPAVIERLASLGYVHQGDLGIPEREAFLFPTHAPSHHLYVCPPHSREFQRHLAFRDYLRANPNEAKAYGGLKKSLALRFPDDWAAYTAGKSEFVEELTSRAMMR